MSTEPSELESTLIVNLRVYLDNSYCNPWCSSAHLTLIQAKAMNREPYAWRYPAVGSLRALDRQATYPEYPESNSYKNYTPDVDSRHTSSRDFPCSSQRELPDYTSSHRSAPSPHASQSSHTSCSGTNYTSPQVQSRQTPEPMDYNVRSDRVSYARRSNPGYDNARINRYGNSMTHHEWETQRFAPVGPPISSGQSYDDQRVRQGSNSCWAPGYTSSTNDQRVRQGSISCWAPGYTSSTNAHERNAMPYDESNREQIEQGDHGYRGNIYGENGLSSDEESQYEWDACYHGTEEVGDYSYAYQDSNYFDDEYEENPDQYAGWDAYETK